MIRLIFTNGIGHILGAHLSLGRGGGGGDGVRVVEGRHVTLDETGHVTGVDQVALRVLKHQVVDERESDHSFHHGHRAGHDARIVSAARLQFLSLIHI